MKPMDFRSRWVLVTGASSGLGLEMARQLGRDHGANIIAVGRRRERLDELRRELEPTGSQVVPVQADLTVPRDVDRVFDEATRVGPLYAGILNAGVTHFGHWHELSWEGFERLLATNVTSVVGLTTRLIPYLEERNDGGGIMLVSSMAGLSPVPYQAAYSGSKAFLVHFGCCLWHELRESNVSITTFAPGGIETEQTSGERFAALRGWLMPVDRCARSGIDAFRRRKYLHVPGVLYKALAILSNLNPEPFGTMPVANTYRVSLEAARKRGF